MSKRLKKYLLLAVKLTIAAALLMWVFRNMDWREFGETLKHARVWPLALAFAGFVLSLVIIAVRLRLLLRVQDIKVRLWEVIRLTFLGQFFNAVVPGVVGGDLVKAFYAAKYTSRKGAAMVTVFVDRLMGLTELVLLAIVMLSVVLLSGKATLGGLRDPAIAAGAALAAVIVMLVFLLSSRLRRLCHLQKLYSKMSIAHHFESAGDAARRFRQRPWELVRAIIITLAAHGTWIAGIALIGSSLSLQVPWYKYFLFVPLIYIIGAVPITPGGVGVVETFYMLFFMSAAVSTEQIAALAVIARSFDILRGLPGLVVVITGTKLPKKEDLEAELGSSQAD